MKQDEDVQLMQILQGLGGRMIWTGAAGTALAATAAARDSSPAPLETRPQARSPDPTRE